MILSKEIEKIINKKGYENFNKITIDFDTLKRWQHKVIKLEQKLKINTDYEPQYTDYEVLIAHKFKTTVELIYSDNKHREIVAARQLCMLIRLIRGETLVKAGNAYLRHYATVLYAKTLIKDAYFCFDELSKKWWSVLDDLGMKETAKEYLKID